MYVASDRWDPSQFCPGSRKAIDLSKKYKEDVLVQSVDVLLEKGVDIPTWLTGTPTLVDTETKISYPGSHALKHLEQINNADNSPPESLSEMEGVPANGTYVAFESDDAFATQESVQNPISDEKITDDDVQKYMQKRSRSQTQHVV